MHVMIIIMKFRWVQEINIMRLVTFGRECQLGICSDNSKNIVLYTNCTDYRYVVPCESFLKCVRRQLSIF